MRELSLPVKRDEKRFFGRAFEVLKVVAEILLQFRG
jgi:hypothetical protein